MLGTVIIVFREILEEALIVSIGLAASIGAPGRVRWSGGVPAGIVDASVVALFSGAIAIAVSGSGPKLFNETILFLAVAMLGWHIIWLSRHDRMLVASARAIGDAVVSGSHPFYVLAVVCGVAVLREGSETVLFLHGTAAGGTGIASMIASGTLGLACVVATGAVVYLGLLHIPSRRLFAVTNWMVLLLAAGTAPQVAGLLVQADILPPRGDAVWDISAALTDESLLGKALHTSIGYVARPDGLQILLYMAPLLAIWLLSLWTPPQAAARRHIQALLLAAGVLGALGAGSPAHAQFKVRYPVVDYREVEIEHFGNTTFDQAKSGKSNNQAYTNEYGFGPLPNWFVELGTEFAAPNGENITYDATEIESYLQLTPTGKYFGDLALFGEFEYPAHRTDAKSYTFGPLAQTEFGKIAGYRALHTANFLFTRTVGNNSTDATQFNIAWQSRLQVDPLIEPGFEYYGQFNQTLSPGKPAEQQHRIGPVLVGLYNFAPYGKLKYELGYLFGLTQATERGAIRWRFEYEIPF